MNSRSDQQTQSSLLLRRNDVKVKEGRGKSTAWVKSLVDNMPGSEGSSAKNPFAGNFTDPNNRRNPSC